MVGVFFVGYKRRLFDNLPVYARLADEEHGLLSLLCDRGIQPQFDDFQRILADQENFYDPDHPIASTHLDWLGQFVALGAIEGHFLGIGINPNWSVSQKRKIIWRAWRYWQSKGTEWGAREAFALWLRWEAAHDKERLLINHPFGDQPTDTPPQWWGWGEGYTGEAPYDTHLLEKYPERQHLGGGDCPGIRYRPFYFTLQQPEWKWEYMELWGDTWVNHTQAPIYENHWSCLGPKNIWFHAYLNEFEWNQIFPDVFELLDEALAINVKPTVFGWLEALRKIQPLQLIESDRSTQFRTIVEFEIDGAQYATVLDDPTPATVNETPAPTEAWAWGGTLWYYPVSDAYTTQEEVTETVWFGNWRPRWWTGMWWGSGTEQELLLEVPEFEIDIVLDLGDLSILSADTTPTFNYSEIQFVSIEAAELWYVPWEERTTTRNSEIIHPASSCLPGVAIEVYQGEMPEIDLGEDWRSLTNQLLVEQPTVFGEWIPGLTAEAPISPEPEVVVDSDWVDAQTVEPATMNAGFEPGAVNSDSRIDEPNWVSGLVTSEDFQSGWVPAQTDGLDEEDLPGFYDSEIKPIAKSTLELELPVQIASHFHVNDEGYPWVVNLPGEASPVGVLDVPAIESPSINLEGITPINATTGYLCNVFGRWSTGEISKYKERKEPINPTKQYGLFDIYPILGVASNAENWRLLVETDQELYILKPITIFWYRGNNKRGDRSVEFSFEKGFTNLYLEFIWQPKQNTQIRSATLWMGETRVQHQTFYYRINAPQKANIGFDFGIPFRLPSGLDTPDDELAVEQLLPLLRDQLDRLERQIVPTPEPIVPVPEVVTGELLSPTPVVQSLRDVLININNRLVRLERLLVENRTGDLHFSYQIQTPVTEIQIKHNFGQFNKQPSITFNCEGIDSEPDIDRLDANTVLVSFGRPTVGWVYFN